MRVIAGLAKGRRLLAPRHRATRPMTDRAREGLFSSLGRAVVGKRVLDLYAGSGSLGLESLSRGAGSAVFVERSRAALVALRANVAAVGLGGEVVAGTVEEYLARAVGPFDLAFVDPPYALPLASVGQVLGGLVRLLVGGGTVVVHRRVGEELAPPPGLEVVDRRRYGDSEITRLVKEGAP